MDENKSLRQVNAVLKKYRPSQIDNLHTKLPSSTTGLTPILTQSYSDVTKIHMPVRQFTTIKRSRQEIGAHVEPQVKTPSPQVDLSLFTLGMGPSLQPPLSAPAKEFFNDDLNEIDEEFLNADNSNDFFDTESSEEGTNLTDPNAIRWSPKTIDAFRRQFNAFPPDVAFDKFDNRLVKTVRQISNENELFCAKCFGMRPLKKHGKVNTSYQFECNGHKISAKQIVENLPDSLILELIPREPTAYFNAILKWLSKDHLSPELVKLTSERNAVKRFSLTQEDEINVCSSLIKSRTVENGIISASLELKTRIATLEETVNRLVKQIEDLAEVNTNLKSENKALLEENKMLKRHLSTPSTPIPNREGHSTYAGISSIIRPLNATMKFYTKAGNLTPKAIIEPVVKQEIKIESSDMHISLDDILSTMISFFSKILVLL